MNYIENNWILIEWELDISLKKNNNYYDEFYLENIINKKLPQNEKNDNNFYINNNELKIKLNDTNEEQKTILCTKQDNLLNDNDIIYNSNKNMLITKNYKIWWWINILTLKIKINIGILADKPGSGKTLTILWLIIYNKKTKIKWNNFISDKWVKIWYKYSDKYLVKTNLIFVPKILINQWVNEIKKTKLLFCIIKKENDVNKIINIENYDVILLNTDILHIFFYKFTSNNYIFSRIIIDECDIFKIKYYDNIPLNYNIIWLISTNLKINTWSHFSKSLFLDNHYQNFKNLNNIDYSIVKNNDKYIDKSCKMRKINYFTYICKTPSFLINIKGIINNKQYDLICSGNIREAIKLFDNTIECDDNISIIKAFEIYINKELENKNNEKQNILNKIMNDDDINKLNNINNEIKSLDIKKNSFINKCKCIIDDFCGICYEPFEYNRTNPVLFKCCNNFFCIICFSKFEKNKCPYCRIIIDKNWIIILDNDVKNKKIGDYFTKMQWLLNIIKFKKNSKILIYCSKNEKIDDISDILNKNNIKNAKIYGQDKILNKYLDKLKNGLIQVIIMKTLNYCDGLDLYYISDIIFMHNINEHDEKKIINRGQRLNRNSDLNIHYILYQTDDIINESTIITNIDKFNELNEL